MMTTARIFAALIVLSACTAWAGAGGGHHEIPHGLILSQVVNLLALVGVLIYVLRGPVRTYFTNRKIQYEQKVQESQASRRKAEAERKDIFDRLERLMATQDAALINSRLEAEALRDKTIAEAQASATKISSEALKTVGLEAERAKAKLRSTLLDGAMVLAKSALSERVGASDQKRLQTEFVEKIQVVQ